LSEAESRRFIEGLAFQIFEQTLVGIGRKHGSDRQRQRLHVSPTTLAGIEKESDLRFCALRSRRLSNNATFKNGPLAQGTFPVAPGEFDPGKDGIANSRSSGFNGFDQIGLNGNALC
jgi:hypothetical protein